MERLDLFTTPVVVFDLPGMDALNRELAQRLLDEEKGTPGLQRSNYGGWHSPMDLTKRPEACFRDMTGTILDHVEQAVAALGRGPSPARLRMVHAWAMIMREGDYTLTHDHGDASWSIAYYVDAGADGGDPDPGGELAFTDPRLGVRPVPELDLFAATFTFQPRASALVLFPGWLKHQVYTYQGRRPRISISANVIMDV